MSIEIKQINKAFGRTPVLNDISLDIPTGKMVALLGPSGSGKPRCCASSPDWSIRTADRFISTAKMSAAFTRVTVRLALCSSTMRCSAT